MVEDEPYPTLLQDKGFRGFPSLAFMDADGEVLATQNDRSVEGFNATFAALQTYLDLKPKADAGDETVANDLFLAELQLGKISFDQAKVRRGALTGLSPEQVARIDAAFVNLEVEDVINKVQTREVDTEEATERFAEMAKADRIPSGLYAPSFWSVVMQYASDTEDAKLFERGFLAIKELLGDNPQYAEMFKTFEERLKELKGKGG